MSVFDTLNKLNVNDKTEKKNGLTYLSWAWAWAEVKKKYPDATYTIYKNENGLPYVCDPNTGYMVYTTVTIEGVTHEMWLPVMDSVNHAMKTERYKITSKYGKETVVEAATMFDVNKAVMRCLTKNLAMFGLGLYIYAGEDLPEEDSNPSAKDEKMKKDLLYGLDYNIIELAKLRNTEVNQATETIKTRLKIDCDLNELPLERLQTVFEIVAGWVQKAKEGYEDTSQN